MGKTSDQNTTQIIATITEKVKQLNNGELSVNDLDALVAASQNLYEHFIILRYKAFDKFGTPATEIQEENTRETNETTADIVEDETPFDFSGITEEVKEQVEQPGFDFEMPSVVEPIKEEAIIEEEQVTEVAEDFVDNTIEKTEPPKEEEESLNDVFKSEDESSLRKQLQNSPISDIKAHISIAKKFEYISSMFNGDADAYKESIEFLNTCATGKDAQLKLNALATENKWDLENKSIIKFIELVERRYL